MVADSQRRVAELRYVDGVEKVEHVPYPNGDEFWVRFNRHLDMRRLGEIAKKHAATVVRFGGLPSKLPRPLAELLWDGVSYVIVKELTGWAKFTATLGFEPDGIAKIANDAHGPFQIFIATQEESIQILYEYLGLKYTPPAPPPKPVVQPEPPTAPVPKTTPPAPQPVVPVVPSAVTATPTASTQTQAAPSPPAQNADATGQTVSKGQYRPHAWGQVLTTSESKPPEPKPTEQKGSKEE